MTTAPSLPAPWRSVRGPSFINGDGLEQYPLTVELRDYRSGRPIPGYAAEECVPLRRSGLREAIGWKGRSQIEPQPGPVLLKVNMSGRDQKPALYALYLSTEPGT